MSKRPNLEASDGWKRPAKYATLEKESAAEKTTGSLIAQFESAEGERAGPQLDVPLDTTPAQLALILNTLLQNEESVPYSFYVGDGEVTGALGEALGDTSTEQAVKIVYVPQAVFRVRAVTRCTSTLPGHAEALLSSSFSPDGKVLAVGKVINVGADSASIDQLPFSMTDKSELFKNVSLAGKDGGDQPPVILFCSLCGHQSQSLQQLKHHCAVDHPR